ncbi:hypothetical protein PAXRUDRAFT_138492, partial [Paxillus rubicundulus Ve08.2h10]
SFYNVEKLIHTFTRVEAIHHNMCPNTCLVYTCLLHNMDACPTYSTSRWNEQKLQGSNGHIKVPTQTFTTIPLSLQLQACNSSPESAQAMHYLHTRVDSTNIRRASPDWKHPCCRQCCNGLGLFRGSS